METPELPQLRITVAADTHIGCPRIDFINMYHNLCTYLYPEIANSHIFFLAGDFFDTLQNLSSRAVMYALRFVYDLLSISEKYGTQIRILHGTYSHDRNQISVFEAFTRTREGKQFLQDLPTMGRMRIINKLEAEEIKELRLNGINYPGSLKVLYVPDSLPYKKGEEVAEKLKEINELVGWTAADLLVGHGTFDFMMPDNVPLPPCTYSVNMFKDIVHGQIVMGHIHTHGKKSNVTYAGSFERIAHNEEEDKGFLVITKQETQWKMHFKTNPGALKFITLYPEGDNNDAIVSDYLRKVEKKFPDLIGYVRVLHNSADVRSILGRITTSRFPRLVYSSKSTAIETKEQLKTLEDYSLAVSDTVIPTEKNLSELIFGFIKERPFLSPNVASLTQEDVSVILDPPKQGEKI